MWDAKYRFWIRQRVKVKRDCGEILPPSPEIQGKLGVIEGYGGLFAAGTKMPLENIPHYFVLIDGSEGAAYLVSEDWLVPFQAIGPQQ